MKKIIFCLALLSPAIFLSCSTNEETVPDTVLFNGMLWTGLEDSPSPGWVSIRGDMIEEIGFSDAPPDAKEKIDVQGGLILPGFNDSHVHFASAGHLLLGINLLDINSDDGLVKRINETTERLPKGSWITRGDWGAYEAWAMGSEGGNTSERRWEPHRGLIDSITIDHPVLITRFDREQGLANQLALDYFGLESESGILEGSELQNALAEIPDKSFGQKKAEVLRGLSECARWGVTTVQDMSPLDYVEVYRDIQDNDSLTCRINFAPSRLSEYVNMKEKGWLIDWDYEEGPRPAGDGWVTFGTLKTHIDGIMGARSARFYEPYSDNSVEMSEWRGGWREFSRDMNEYKRMILEADRSGIQMRIHAIGDEANSILLDILDTMDLVNGARDRRFRLVHAQVIHPDDFPRFSEKKIVAEVQPYHVADDMRWMEERIGYQRCKGAYAFKTLQDSGCILSFGSDWPGTNASYYPINPLFGIYSAVTRQTVQGKPEGGWFPEQRIDLNDALMAYTWGSAFGAFEEKQKGTIEPGKWADITVLQENIFDTEPSEWLNTEVALTMVGGRVVYSSQD